MTRDVTIELIDAAIEKLDRFMPRKPPLPVGEEIGYLFIAQKIKFYLVGYKDCFLKNPDKSLLMGMLKQVDENF